MTLTLDAPAHVGEAPPGPRPLDTPVVLEVKDLKTHFPLREGLVRAVDGVSYKLHRGRTLGVVGESGCGKSVTAQSVLRIVPRPGKIVGGEILLHRDGGSGGGGGGRETVDLTKLDPQGREIRALRGNEISYIYQEPMSALSPVHTIGHVITEVIRLHQKVNQEQARAIAIDTLTRVGLPRAEYVMSRYPHQLSGGMRQRAVIGIALACRPSILIADEPTTALDVTTEAVVLDLLRSLQNDFGMAIQIITHNLGVVAELADEVVVMYLGRQVEQAPVAELFENPLHPYTRALLRSMPRMTRGTRERLESIKGMVPDPFSVPKGCAYHTRCPHYEPGTCDDPQWREITPNHWVRCSRAEELVVTGLARPVN
ncbi:MAG TPA: ABC transporter ATP-binding protein [Chloroflexota bacterium]|nr:ABC transporter ATP-binding protein [Chloroflexota bacterium]